MPPCPFLSLTAGFTAVRLNCGILAILLKNYMPVAGLFLGNLTQSSVTEEEETSVEEMFLPYWLMGKTVVYFLD